MLVAVVAGSQEVRANVVATVVTRAAGEVRSAGAAAGVVLEGGVKWVAVAAAKEARRTRPSHSRSTPPRRC